MRRQVLFFRYVQQKAKKRLQQIDKPEEIVRELSEQKATAVALNFDMEEGTVVIGADTIVSYNNEILGNPVDESDAFKTLKMLQGNIHQVYTGLTRRKARWSTSHLPPWQE